MNTDLIISSNQVSLTIRGSWRSVREYTEHGITFRDYERQYSPVSAKRTISLPSGYDSSNIKVESFTLSENSSVPAGCYVSYSPSRDVIVQRFNAGETSIDISFSMSRNTEVKNEVQSSYWPDYETSMPQSYTSTRSNIVCSIEYEPKIAYNFDKTIVANGDSLQLNLVYSGAINIEANNLIAKIVNDNNDTLLSFVLNPEQQLDANTVYSLSAGATYTGSNTSKKNKLLIYNGSTQLYAFDIDNLIVTRSILQTPSFMDDFNIHRYAIILDNIEITTDGEKLLVNGSIFIDPESFTKKVTISCTDPELSYSTDTIAVDDSGEYNFDLDTTIFGNQEFYNNRGYTFDVILQDDYHEVIQTIEVTQASGYLNIEKSGVAVGGISRGTEDSPRFECYYPMYIVFGHYKYKIKLETINDLRCLVVDTDSAEYIDDGHSQTEFVPYILYDISIFSPEAGVDSNEAIRYIQATDQTESGFYSVQWHYERDRSIYAHDNNECSPFLIQTAGMVIQKPLQNSMNTYGCIDTVETIRIPTNAKYLNFTVYHNYASDGWFGYGIISPTSKMYNTFSEEGKSDLKRTDIYATTSIGRSTVTVQLDVSQADKTANWRIGVVFRSKYSTGYPELTIKKIWFSDD